MVVYDIVLPTLHQQYPILENNIINIWYNSNDHIINPYINDQWRY